MKTLALNQYMPQLQETRAKFYFPVRSMIGWGVMLALLVVSLVWARQYPINRTIEAEARIVQLAERLEASRKKSIDALALVRQALEAKGMTAENSARMTAAIAAQLEKLQPVTVAMLDEFSDRQAKAYQEAQQVIASSAYKGVPVRDLPLTAEAEKYRQALEVDAPAPLRYLRLEDGASKALAMLSHAVTLQGQAEQMWARFAPRDANGQVNYGEVATAQRERGTAGAGRADRGRKGANKAPAPGQASDWSSFLSELGKGKDEAPAEGEAPTSDAMPALPVMPASVQENPVDAAQREFEAEQRRQADAERRQVEAEKRQQQQQAMAEQRRQQEAERQARAKVEAERQAKAKAEAAEKRRQQECTSSIFSRLNCAAQGRNPVTGE